MFKKILVPIDLTHAERAKVMLDLAAKMGGKGVQITLINVIEDIPAYVASELPRGLFAERQQKAKKELQAMARAAGHPMDAEIRVGKPATAILDAAEDMAAELVIIASHRPGLQDYLLGSTAGRVVRHANCSVLVLR